MFSFSGLWAHMQSRPHGYWDAWAIWNTHARFLYRDGPGWKEHIQYTFHPDYPLLTSATVARLWRYAGLEVSEVPALFGIVFLLSTVGLIGTVLAMLSGPVVAVICATVLVGTPLYLEHSISQYADVPLSFFILATIALIYLRYERWPTSRGTLILAGFLAGCAGWTKNEGLLFILCISSSVLLLNIREPRKAVRELCMFSAGLLLPLTVIALFKFSVPQNDLMYERNSHEVIAKMLSVERHEIILRNFAETYWSFGEWKMQPIFPLVAFVLIFGSNLRGVLKQTGWLVGVSTVTMVTVGYYVAYLTTPNPLQLHLDTSVTRLFLHVLPSELLLLGLVAQVDKKTTPLLPVD
jgi:hypothetical protein